MQSPMFLVTSLVFSVYLVSKSSAMFISWSDKVKVTDDNIFISMRNILVPGMPLSRRFRNLTQSMSLDERCAGGYPLSMAWSPHEPYSGMQGPKEFNGTKGVIAFGIFPGVIRRIVRHCCPRSKIEYAKLMKSVRQADDHLTKSIYDFTYPIYVQRWKSTTYKDQPFVPVVQAPRVMLIVYDDLKVSKTSLLVETIFGAWPFLMFIFGISLAAGLLVWLLEKMARSQEFTFKFIQGAWDGFWWAIVTMTTVGYGDKTPKTVPGRLFCLIWIIVGVNIVACFTALITATVTANTKPYFNVIGSKIGAVNGSEEFRLGVTLNADMKGFRMPSAMTKALKKHDIDGILIDNYALTRFSNFIVTEKNIRLESTIEHSINYGMVLPSGNTKTETCVRRYMKNYRHEIFSSISKELTPLTKKKGSQADYSVEAAGDLFYQESLFKTVIHIICIIVGCLVVIGLVWEYGYKRRICCRRSSNDNSQNKCEDKLVEDNQDLTAIERKRKELLSEHRKFQTKWIEQLSSLSSTRQK